MECRLCILLVMLRALVCDRGDHCWDLRGNVSWASPDFQAQSSRIFLALPQESQRQRTWGEHQNSCCLGKCTCNGVMLWRLCPPGVFVKRLGNGLCVDPPAKGSPIDPYLLQPRKGAFEVRWAETGDAIISLLNMPRPFPPLKALDIEQLAKDIGNMVDGN